MRAVKTGVMALACVAALCGSLLSAQDRASGAGGPKQELHKVADGVYAMVSLAGMGKGQGLTSNAAFVVGSRAVLVFDAQSEEYSRELLAEVRKVTSLPVKYVVVSHYHGDHTDGAGVFEGADIIAHENLATSMRAEDPAKRKGPLPTLTYKGQLSLDLGGRTVDIRYLGPTHTTGDSVAYLPESKVLLSGDVFVTNSVGNLAEADCDGYHAALEELKKWDIGSVVPGHGPLARKEDLGAYEAYLDDLTGQVQQLMAKGLSLEQIQAQVDVKKYAHIRNIASMPRNLARIYEYYKEKNGRKGAR